VSEPSPRPDEPTGTIGPTRLNTLLATFVIGGLLGFALVPIATSISGTAPRIEWTSVGVLFVMAGMLAVLAYNTHRTVQKERRRIEPRRAVNLLLVAKAGALVGAFVAGGYLGFVLHFIDDLDVPLPRERVIRGLAAAVTGVALVISGVFLERACRIPEDPDD
jgi:uncharacterized membrane protein YidH (DUF202 family)